MKKVILFPGIDALMEFKLRALAYEIDSVKEQIQITQNLLNSKGLSHLDLVATMTKEHHPTPSHFQSIVICSVATQVALFKDYEDRGLPIDILLGVSLGDLARSHCAGIVSYEEMLNGVLIFTQISTQTMGLGETIYVKTEGATTIEDLDLGKFDLEISIHQTKESFLLSGGINNIKSWIKEVAGPNKVTARKIFPMPLAIHNKLMNPVAEALKSYAATLDLGGPRYRIFSSNLMREIETAEEFNLEMVQNVKATVYFYQSIQSLLEKEGPIEFISIGPAPTLLSFIQRMNIAPGLYKLTNHFEQEVKKSNLEVMA